MLLSEKVKGKYLMKIGNQFTSWTFEPFRMHTVHNDKSLQKAYTYVKEIEEIVGRKFVATHTENFNKITDQIFFE